MVRIFFLPYLANRSKSYPCSYEHFCLESHILSFPKVLQIPPESPCIRESAWIPDYTTLEAQRPQHGRLATCVIVQQYSTATSVSLRLHSLKENFGALFKIVLSSILLHFVKSRGSKSALLENVYPGNCLFGEKGSINCWWKATGLSF
jgi:hypothetical protein